MADNECFSLVDENGHSLDLSSTSDRVLSWLDKINSILAEKGLSMVIEEKQETQTDTAVRAIQSIDTDTDTNIKPNRRDSIQHATILPTSMVSSQSHVFTSFLSASGTKLLEFGRTFTIYSNRLWRREVYVFYQSASDGSLGSLWWTKTNSRDRHEHIVGQNFDLRELIGVHVGKKTEMLLSAEAAEPTRCFSLLSENGSLDLEAGSEDHCVSWLLGQFRSHYVTMIIT